MGSKMTDILLIEDNQELGSILGDFLRRDGFGFHQALSGEEGLRFMKDNEVGIILLDIMLLGIDGITVCSKIRETKNVPIIILSAKTDKENKLNGLLSGADDYMEKPYDIDILLAKVKSVYKRNYETASILTEGSLEINSETHVVKQNGTELNLNPKEFELLELLVRNKGKVLKKEWMFNQVWGIDSFSEQSTLTVHIKWLREKIEKDAKNPEHILTVWGVGYKFKV